MTAIDIDTLPGLLSHWATEKPSKPAVRTVHGALSFAELDAKVRDVADGLRRLNVGPGSVVGLICTNRSEWILVTLATAHLGGCVAAFNTWARQWDLQHMVRESGCEVLVALSGFRGTDIEALVSDLVPEAFAAEDTGWKSESFPDLREIVIIEPTRRAPGIRNFKDLAGSSGKGTESAPPADASDDPPILVMYTSGSTARPKAVPMHHRTLVQHGREVGKRMGISGLDRVWIPVPLFWSYGGANALMVALSAGATIVLQEVFEASEALSIIESERCTVAYTLPNITNALLADPGFDRGKIADLKKGMTIGSPNDLERAGQALGVTGICNAYGSTELYGGCCVTPTDWPLAKKVSTQGPPLPGNTVTIRDPETGEVLPVDAVGEITVTGQVTSGYMKQPEQNREAFTSDGAFRTGDLGSMDADGNIHFVARSSEMIRTGGINIAPAEIEEFLRSHPGIDEIAVVGVPDEAKGELAIAVLTAKVNDTPPDETSLKSFCRDRIASYKIPVRFFVTNEPLPKTDTGKLSRNGVRKIAMGRLAEKQNS